MKEIFRFGEYWYITERIKDNWWFFEYEEKKDA